MKKLKIKTKQNKNTGATSLFEIQFLLKFWSFIIFLIVKNIQISTFSWILGLKIMKSVP
jgi:hypothetical protein